MMKKLLYALLLSLPSLVAFGQADDEVLMKVDNRPVTVGEFKYN